MTKPPLNVFSEGIELRSVSKRFDAGHYALKDISLAIAPGEFVSLLGPSGCGKSTVLKLMAGLMEPSSGSVRINGGAASARGMNDVGFVFQDPTLMPWASVADNVRLPLRLRREPERSSYPLVEEALKAVGLSEVSSAYPRQLSGGMKMRVSIARALVTKPRLLLMDEPFAALDDFTRRKLCDDVIRLWSLNKLTVVFVTHSLWESVYVSRRVLIMGTRPGRLVKDIAIHKPATCDKHYITSEAYARSCQAIALALEESGSNDLAH